MALETPPVPVALLALPHHRFRGRRHQGADERQAPLGWEFFHTGGGQGVVLRRTGDACSCPDETGMGNQGAARPAWPQENGQENGRGVECALYRCLVSGVFAGRRAHGPGPDAPAVRDAVAWAPSPLTPPPSPQRREVPSLRRPALPASQPEPPCPSSHPPV